MAALPRSRCHQILPCTFGPTGFRANVCLIISGVAFLLSARVAALTKSKQASHGADLPRAMYTVGERHAVGSGGGTVVGIVGWRSRVPARYEYNTHTHVPVVFGPYHLPTPRVCGLEPQPVAVRQSSEGVETSDGTSARRDSSRPRRRVHRMAVAHR